MIKSVLRNIIEIVFHLKYIKIIFFLINFLQQKNKKIIIFLETPRNFKLPLNNENNFKNYLFTLARKKIKKLILNIFFIKTKRNLQLLNLNHESFFLFFSCQHPLIQQIHACTL
jgi:hypothetical protein